MSTSIRISDATSRWLSERASREGTSAQVLLNRLIREGVAQLEHPGIVFRGPIGDRRAALAAGPDVWEIVARLQELDGPVERRIAVLSAQSDLHSRKIELAVAYAREHGSEIGARIGRNRESTETIQRGAGTRMQPAAETYGRHALEGRAEG
ncbi:MULTISPECIES: hypothetical protein [unclassified Nocardia]|uniref:hypothetical protein n=1 Tax=unclassified Nocardia TaxID=2637762 RepID=UPI001CE3C532|nr:MULTISPECIES: hypothetical protein [unclassified Nocardia]